MEIVTDEPINILSQLFIPLLMVTASYIITAKISNYLKKEDKNQHIRFLRTNYSIIDSYFNSIKTYRVSQVLSPVFFMVAVTFGIVFELFIMKLRGKFLDYILGIEYIKKM